MAVNGDAKTVIRALALTPERLRELSRGADDDALATRPSVNEWSATEIVAHLLANADVWGSSIERMLNEDHPTIRYVSPRGVMKRPEYSGRAFSESLKLFIAGRRELINTLMTLPPEGWSRGAKFTGTTRRWQTVMSYAERIAAHEREHILQFAASLAPSQARR